MPRTKPTPKVELTIRLYSPRWGHEDPYTFEWTTEGWILHHGHSHPLTPDGAALNSNSRRNAWVGVMRNDSIYPPDVLDTALGHLWQEINDGMSQEKAQAAMKELETWINGITLSRPSRNEDSLWQGVF